MRRTFTPLPILEREGVVIQSTGADTWRCKCPVHGGDGPSMAIRLRDGAWRLTCFACGFNGTAIGLVMALKQCDARESVRILGEGVFVPDAPPSSRPTETWVLSCDMPDCRSTREIACTTYKTSGKGGFLWTSTHIEEAMWAETHGWTMSAHAEFALCPECTA